MYIAPSDAELQIRSLKLSVQDIGKQRGLALEQLAVAARLLAELARGDPRCQSRVRALFHQIDESLRSHD